MSATLNVFLFFNETGTEYTTITIVGTNFGVEPDGIVLSTNDNPGIPFATISQISDTEIVADVIEYEGGALDVRVRNFVYFVAKICAVQPQTR